MFKNIIIIFLLCFCHPTFSQVDKIAMSEKTYDSDQYHPQIIVFKVKQDYRAYCFQNSIQINDINNVISELGVKSLSKNFPNHTKPKYNFSRISGDLKPQVDLSLIYKYEFTSEVDINQAVQLFKKLPYFEYIQPLPKVNLMFTPDDPQLGNQYYLTTIGALNAWDIEQGDTNVVVGIVDTGVELLHDDLKNQIKYNYADPINGIDDDLDGYIDNFMGWDTGENDNDPSDNVQHGTTVAGMSSAQTNNGIGIAAVGYKTKFLPIKITNAAGQIMDGYPGIIYAADHGCKIINASWGSPSSAGQYGQDVIDYAVSKGSIVISAAGNDGNGTQYYPAVYNNVLAVGATNGSDTRWGNSNFYKEIDISAPGQTVRTTNVGNGYKIRNGTSESCPLVAGCAALVASKYPSLTGLQIGELLKATADNIDALNPGFENLMGTGRVNVFRALTELPPSISISNVKDYVVLGGLLQFSGTFTNVLNPSSPSLKATIRSNSPFVGTITDSTINLGVIGTSSSKTNLADPFELTLVGAIPSNTSIPILITYTDGNYNVTECISIIVNKEFLDIEDNLIATTLTSKGAVGYNKKNQVEGQGIKYNSSPNMLWSSSFMVGVQGNLVSDNERGIGLAVDADFVSVSNIAKSPSNLIADNEYANTFNDNNNLVNKVGVTVSQKNYTWNSAPDDKYVIYEYIIKNTSGSNLTNMYAGHFTDWDINDYSKNSANEDLVNKMGYIFDTQPGGLYGGVKLLSAKPFVHYAFDNINGGGGGVNLNNGFTESEKYTSMQGGRSAAGIIGTGNDVMDFVGSGPFNLANGDSIKVAFALIAGNSLVDIQNSAIAAQTKYNDFPVCNPIAIRQNGTTNFCAGDSVKLDFVPDPLLTKYNWNTGETSAAIQAKNTGNYYCQVTDTFGCVHMTDTVKVLVNSDVTTVNLAGSASFCKGDSLVLSAAGTLSSVVWSTGLIAQNLTTKTAGSYSFTAKDGLGCTITSDTVNTLINNPLPLNIIPNGKISFCEGEQVELDGNSSFSNHKWNSGELTQKKAVTNAGTSFLTAHDVNGCLSISDTISVVTSPVGTKNSQIKGKVTFNGFAVNGGKAILYYDLNTLPFKQKIAVVDVLGNFVFDSLPQNDYLIKIIPPAANVFSIPTYYGNVYKWELASKLPITCFDTLAPVIDLILTSTTIGNSVINGYVYNDTLKVADATVIFTALKFDKIVGYSNSDATGNFWFNTLAKGNYKLEVDIAGYKQDSLVSIQPSIKENEIYSIDFCLQDSLIKYCPGVTAIDEVDVNENNFILYPNPFYESFTLTYELFNTANVEVALLDLLGNKLQAYIENNQTQGNHTFEFINLKELANGVYLLRLTVNNQIFYKKVVHSN